jgi:hypothetical protein
MATQLVQYDTMRHHIELAHRIDEVKDIRDKAEALEHYMRLAKDTDAERACREIRERAEKKAGRLLKERDKPMGRPKKLVGTNNHFSEASKPKSLTELKISKEESVKWQGLSTIPDEITDARWARGESAYPLSPRKTLGSQLSALNLAKEAQRLAKMASKEVELAQPNPRLREMALKTANAWNGVARKCEGNQRQLSVVGER